MSTWEYKVTGRYEDDLLTEEQLNVLGAAGLELISVVVAQQEQVVIGRQERRNKFYYFFRQPRAGGADKPADRPMAARPGAPRAEQASR